MSFWPNVYFHFKSDPISITKLICTQACLTLILLIAERWCRFSLSIKEVPAISVLTYDTCHLFFFLTYRFLFFSKIPTFFSLSFHLPLPLEFPPWFYLTNHLIDLPPNLLNWWVREDNFRMEGEKKSKNCPKQRSKLSETKCCWTKKMSGSFFPATLRVPTTSNPIPKLLE